jgi:hypothetical protein
MIPALQTKAWSPRRDNKTISSSLNAKVLAQLGLLLCLVALSIRSWRNPWQLGPDNNNEKRQLIDSGFGTTRITPSTSATLKSLRRVIEMACSINETNMVSAEDLHLQLDGRLATMYVPPAANVSVDSFSSNYKDPVRPCMYTFIDLGSNIGKKNQKRNTQVSFLNVVNYSEIECCCWNVSDDGVISIIKFILYNRRLVGKVY